MKKAFLKPENLLLLIPLLLHVADRIINGNTALDIHFHDTYIVVSDSFVFLVMFGFMFVPYLFHFLLRAQKKWSPLFCNVHIYGSIILQILIFFSFNFQYKRQAPQKYFDASNWESFNEDKMSISLSMLLYLLLQFIFTCYFVVRMFRKSRS